MEAQAVRRPGPSCLNVSAEPTTAAVHDRMHSSSVSSFLAGYLGSERPRVGQPGLPAKKDAP